MSDVIYTAADGQPYKAVRVLGDNRCTGCAFEDMPWHLHCEPTRMQGMECTGLIWQPLTIQKPQDTFHKWLEENAEMFRPIYEAMKGKK